MDATRFDGWTRTLSRTASRRHTLAGIVLGGLAVMRSTTKGEARKKRKKKAIAINAFGCVNVGGKCYGRDDVFCSGTCAGKKPKKGKPDRRKCVAHGVDICTAQDNSCLANVDCGTGGSCFQTTGQSGFCGDLQLAKCRVCQKDADCVQDDFGTGSACIVCSKCPDTGNTACAAVSAFLVP